jgi:hypothetical protein
MSDDPSRATALLGKLLCGLLLPGVLLMTAACGDESRAASSARLPPTGEWSTAGCAMPRSPQVTTMGGSTVPVTPPALEAAIARIEEGGRNRFPDSYAGLEVDQRQVRAIVYRVASAAFDDFVRITAEDACVVVRDAAHSSAELTAWQDRIAADLGRWGERGVRISSVGARHDGAGVEIGAQDVAAARRELPAYYGAAAPLVFVEQGPVTPMPAPGQRQAAQPGG